MQKRVEESPLTKSKCYSAEISLQGEKYLDKQIENAISGIKEMKNVMQQSEQDHQRYLDSLEKAKLQKEVRTRYMTTETAEAF